MSQARPNERPRVVVVAGPTAAGKTELAIALARRFAGEIVNADSMQVYRHLDVGTAKPTPAQRAEVPHHLIDVAGPDEQYSAGRYAAEAAQAVGEIRARGRVPILAGGTGLYLRAYLEGLLCGAEADPDTRAALEAEHRRAATERDPDRMHRELAALDPEAARRIHPRDVKRTLRALELHRATGLAPTELRRERGFSERRVERLYLVVDPGREELAARIDRRCVAMIEGGLLQEVRRLRAMGYGPELPSMQAIGYRHMQLVIDGQATLASVLPRMQRDTRQFARRQRTWFRGVRGAVWAHPGARREIEARVERFLAGSAEAEEPRYPPPAVV
jgi:tRNA dimethylallyltransferase